MTHHHIYAHHPLCEMPTAVFLTFELPLFVFTRSLLSRCQREGKLHRGLSHRSGCPPSLPSTCRWAHREPRAGTALGPVDTNPGEPRPLSPGNSCSVSALEGTLRTSVIPEAASGCHQHTYSKKGRILLEQEGERRLQLKLIIVRRAIT